MLVTGQDLGMVNRLFLYREVTIPFRNIDEHESRRTEAGKLALLLSIFNRFLGYTTWVLSRTCCGGMRSERLASIASACLEEVFLDKLVDNDEIWGIWRHSLEAESCCHNGFRSRVNIG